MATPKGSVLTDDIQKLPQINPLVMRAISCVYLTFSPSRLKEYIINVHKKLEEQEKDAELICKRLEYTNEQNENLEIRRREFEQIADRMTDAKNRLQEEFDNFKRYVRQDAFC